MAIIYRRNEDSAHLALGGDLLLLLTAFLGLLCFGSLLGLALFFLQRHRKRQAALQDPDSKNTRQLMIKTIPFGGNRGSQMYSEKQGLMDHSSPMPMTPDSIPEIRITFPEEEDSYGRRKSGRVVIVQVGEAGVGFVRPVPEDNLPPYQQHDGFSTVNLEKIGGLKEKNQNQWV